jgi:D-alanine-D-alanine ligase
MSPSFPLDPGVIDPRAVGHVGVLMGGRSSEREISLRSGAAVLQALQAAGVHASAFDPAERPLAALPACGFDRVFLILHGGQGEDGSVQGALEVLGIPYTGSAVLASALAMDKHMSKCIWRDAGLPTPPWRCVGRGDSLGEAPAGPVVVKPACEGSTVGVTKVAPGDGAALAAALELALHHDRRALVEACVSGRELTCAILGEGASAHALPLVEIRAPDANYDYHNKYFGNATEYLCPAPLPAELAAHIQDLCLRAYRALDARGWGRVDVMLGEQGAVLGPALLELNTAPGMTDHSLVPMAARAAGMDFGELVLRIAADCRRPGGGVR